MLRFFRTGSFGNGTSISGYSDVDYFASLPSEHISSYSESTLIKSKSVLDTRFALTGVHIDSPAVVVPFGSIRSETTEIVPAAFISKHSSGAHIYTMPDGYGGWIYSSPEIHNKYVFDLDTLLGGKLRPLIRFVKAWKYYYNVPISSFYLELFVSVYASTNSPIIYYWDLKNIFSRLNDSRLSVLSDPCGISGTIPPCSSEAERQRALLKVETACRRITNAFAAEQTNDTPGAFYWLNELYNGNFPAYG